MMWSNLPSDCYPSCYPTSLHTPWHVPWLPATTGMTVAGRPPEIQAATSIRHVYLFGYRCVTRSLVSSATFRRCRNQGLIQQWESEVCPTQFKVYMAGGMSEAASGGAASYEPTLEMFDSRSNKWTIMGSMPVEFAARLTVWTPNESVYSREVLYWMTSACAYSIMGFEMSSNKWIELSVPMGDTLEFAAMVPRDGKLTVIGGTQGRNVLVWELGEGGEWNVIERMPVEVGNRFTGGSTKCVGIEGGGVFIQGK
ncbi:hypothetical protein L1987_67005 [Smallanthus sonchifolius]|uniref:Uncharacterized protein n=1 Tax=Smallanthus sonchifolius TaxID=185202 RepID=A0ACB9BZ28_9ASTR|nr:hypothetical protein L1987_67005 [Smallanthus sonchifolius]